MTARNPIKRHSSGNQYPFRILALLLGLILGFTPLLAQPVPNPESSELPPGLDPEQAEKLQRFQDLINGQDVRRERSELEKTLLESGLENLGEEGIDALLEKEGLSTEGTLEQKKDRLKVHLGLQEPPNLAEKSNPGRIMIENAAEGEYIRGEEDSRGLLKLRGRIRVRVGDGYFLADLVIVDSKRKEVYAEGNVVYKSKDALIRAERIIYDQRLGAGIMYNASGYKDPVHFIGENVRQLSEGKLSVSHVYFTGCAAEPPHYNFYARRVWLYEDDSLAAAGVLYYVGGVPLLPLPFLYASDWGTGIISQFGHSQVQGFFWQNTYQFSVPEAITSSFLPMGYRITADYYENTGEVFGLEMFRFSPNLNYFLDLEAARFKRYEIISDYRQRDQIAVTNQVQHSDGTYGKEYYKWYKAFAIVNWRNADYRENSVQTLNIRYEDYSYNTYEYEFGSRYQPVSTIPALYQNSEAGRGLIRNDTDWNLVYSDQRDDLSIRVQASRRRVWIQDVKFEDSRYYPAYDVVPAVDLEKNIFLGRDPWFDLAVYWDHALSSDLTKQYSAGVVDQSLNHNEYKTAFRTYVSWYPYFTFRPLVGYGARKTLPYGNNPTGEAYEALDAQAQKDSYQYYFTEDELTLGPDVLFVRAIYRRKDSFKEELKDRGTLNFTGFTNNQKVNETEVSLESYPLEDVSFSVTSIYDQKDYEYDIKPEERWYYPVFRTDILIDFFDPFGFDRNNLLSRRRGHFMDLHITNDYVYDPINKRDHSNIFGLNFQTGGFDLWLLERLRYFEMGFYWYHIYYDRSLDHMRFNLKMDIQLTRTIYWEMELESRATDPARYNAAHDPRYALANQSLYTPESERPVNFTTDVFNGTGLAGERARQNAVFNVGFFETAFIMDLHDWEMRVGYRLEQRSILGGLNTVEVVNFYDNKVFFSLTLLRFDVGNISSRPSRFILNRQRIRPSDIGRGGYSSVGP
ncbi:MAG: hypothetical protein RH862_07875 [Leptospiraceae bacterium]